MTDRFTHAPNQAISAFVHNYSQHAGSDGTHRCWCGPAVVELYPLAQPAQCTRRGHSHDLGEVLLFDPERRMREPLGEVPVVREQQKSLGRDVETADGKHTGICGHHVDDRRAPLRVGRRGDDPGALVEEIADESRSNREGYSVHLDHIAVGIDLPAERGGLAVHLHPPDRDQDFAGSTAPEPAPGERLLQALFWRAHIG